MLREHLNSSRTSGEPGFHWRGAEVTRLEGFTDAVFAFAVTLLVVSLEVPKTFPELLAAMHGFLAFGVCFGLLANVWYQHYRPFFVKELIKVKGFQVAPAELEALLLGHPAGVSCARSSSARRSRSPRREDPAPRAACAGRAARHGVTSGEVMPAPVALAAR
jgi:hypothetical protein